SIHICDVSPSILDLKRRQSSRSTLFPYTTLFRSSLGRVAAADGDGAGAGVAVLDSEDGPGVGGAEEGAGGDLQDVGLLPDDDAGDRKSTRLNSSHVKISYAVFCLKKNKSHYMNRL